MILFWLRSVQITLDHIYLGSMISKKQINEVNKECLRLRSELQSAQELLHLLTSKFAVEHAKFAPGMSVKLIGHKGFNKVTIRRSLFDLVHGIQYVVSNNACQRQSLVVNEVDLVLEDEC